jgi:hypothetical protein
MNTSLFAEFCNFHGNDFVVGRAGEFLKFLFITQNLLADFLHFELEFLHVAAVVHVGLLPLVMSLGLLT